MKMKYEKPQIEVMDFDFSEFYEFLIELLSDDNVSQITLGVNNFY